MKHTLLTGLLIGAALLWPTASFADENATTWRAGHPVWLLAGCHEVEDALAWAKEDGTGEAFTIIEKFIGEGKCFLNRNPQPAKLVKWMRGPFTPKNGYPDTYSIWMVFDTDKRTSYAAYMDSAGPYGSGTVTPGKTAF